MGATLNVIKGSRQHNDYSRWWNQDWGRKEDDYPLTGVWKPSRLFTLQPFTLEPPPLNTFNFFDSFKRWPPGGCYFYLLKDKRNQLWKVAMVLIFKHLPLIKIKQKKGIIKQCFNLVPPTIILFIISTANTYTDTYTYGSEFSVICCSDY